MIPLSPDESTLLAAARMLWEWLCRLDETEKARVLLEHLPYLIDDHQDICELRKMTDTMLSHVASREAYEAEYEGIWEAEPPPTRGAIEASAASLPRYGWALSMCQKHGCKSCIDLGAGNGNLVLYLALHGIDGYGVNLTTRCVVAATGVANSLGLSARFIREHAELWQSETPADACCAFEILEHVISPQALIDNMERNVKPGGLLLLTTPLGSTTLGWDTWFERNYRIAIPHTHVRAYTERRLRELIGNKPGLRIEQQESGVRPIAGGHNINSGVLLLAASWRRGDTQ